VSTGSPGERSIARETADGWLFRIDPPDLTFIRIDYQTRLQFSATEFVIEERFELITPEGRHQLDPSDRSSLGPLLGLYPSSLVSAESSHGTLTITFEDGATLIVPTEPSI
jgi:hypothetical protein